ncbi:MAG: hypothetical protein WCZ24_03595 [Bacilli bacterium]|jgi:hypothetical protein
MGLFLEFLNEALPSTESLLLRFDENHIDSGKDIDILVSKKDMKKVIVHLAKKSIEQNHIILKIHNTKYYSAIHILFRKENTFFPLYFEIRNQIHENNTTIVTFEDLQRLSLIVKNNHNYFDLLPTAEIALLELRNFIAKREYDAKHYEILKRANVEDSLKLLLLFNVKKYEAQDNKIISMNFGFKGKIKSFLFRCKSKIDFRKITTPKHIVFYGPDGVGKTSIVNGLYHRCEDFKNIARFYFYSELKDDDSSLVVPRRTEISKFRKFLINSPLFIVAFIIFKHFKFYRDNKNKLLTFSDRLLIDYYLKRYDNNEVSLAKARVLRPYTKNKTTLNIVLHDSSKKIIARKQELSDEQIKFVYRFINEAFSKKQKNVLFVDLEECASMEDAHELIYSQISNFNYEMYEKHMKKGKSHDN